MRNGRVSRDLGRTPDLDRMSDMDARVRNVEEARCQETVEVATGEASEPRQSGRVEEGDRDVI